MRIYIIGSDGITLCREPPAAVNEGEIAVASSEELHAPRLSHFVARISSRAKSPPCICIYERRRYSGRPSSSMRFSEATAMATSVVCRPLVRECSASPITRL